MSKQSDNEIQNLRKENKILKQIIDSLDATVYWKDLEGKFLGMNKKGLSLLGFNLTNEDIIGKTDSGFESSKKYKENIYKNDLHVINTKKTVVFEEDYVATGGTEKATYLSTKSCLTNENGEVIGLAGVSVDITEQKKLQNELEEKTKELEETNMDLEEKNRILQEKEDKRIPLAEQMLAIIRQL
ncbi:PAS domain-containing protein [Francisella sp. TX07-6608]|uniref:PAS domain-containing protein n=1 Tax=Francisella sp. TX07-6608 TaxID=573568 RepID=UPI0008F98B71|nr:PAS domain-containing protein [Francisella sp. TX07-6608]OIN85120.1 sensory box protein [Francisella sp. TX07-6608]